ncbi:putative sister chromatid cohesion C-terminus, partial [Trypoxylus dichotomus]
MDRDTPSVPITTLAGVASLTDLLPEMPLPTPLPQTLSNKSLLFHPRVAEEALNLLGVRDETLVPQLVHSLVQTSADHIEVKDNYAGAEPLVDQQERIPELLRAMMDTNPNVFNGTKPVTANACQITLWNHTNQISTANLNQACDRTQSQQPQMRPPSPKSARLPGNISQRPSVITEQKLPVPPVVCNSTHISKDGSTQNAHIQGPDYSHANARESNPTEQLRQLRGPSPAQASDAPIQSPVPAMESHNTRSKTKEDDAKKQSAVEIKETAKDIKNAIEEKTTSKEICKKLDNTNDNNVKDTGKDVRNKDVPVKEKQPGPAIMQPFVRLHRISTEDQQMLQLSLSDFAENRPRLAKELGIVPSNNKFIDENAAFHENSDSEVEDAKRKCRKDRKNYNEEDGDYFPDKFSQLVGGKRKRKEEKFEPLVVKPKLRRVEKKFVPVLEKLSVEELMETNTFDRFNRNVEHVLKSSEDIDFSEITEDGIVPEEHLLNRHTLQELNTETAKLRNLGATEMIPAEKLVRLLNILEINIRGGDRVSPITDEDNESIRQMWMETTMERVMGAADACLICLHILTSPNMPKRVYIEDVIDRVVLFIKYQMHNTIFPSYDSTYRLDNRKKDGRRKKTAHVLEKSVTTLYNKVAEMINLLAELLNIQILTDTSVLHASSMGVSPFFAENVSELQLACLKLVTTIFTKYEKHRRLLLDDILASIARLPSTKRSLRTYRLNSEECIQMLTALVLQLIQCVVALPESLANKNIIDSAQNENVKNVDSDVLICNKYEKATSTAGTFLTVFLSKCGSKSEDIDYRPLFENFVQDLLSTVNKPEWPATELLLSLLGKMLVKNFSNKGTDMSLRVASLDYLGVVAARLRRDSVMSRCKLNTIDQIIKEIKSEEMKENDEESQTK